MKLSEYLVDRGSGQQLAQALDVPPELVSQWKNGVRAVPLDRCMAIERATGGRVTRRDLRPDDWQEHWPELIDRRHAERRDGERRHLDDEAAGKAAGEAACQAERR